MDCEAATRGWAMKWFRFYSEALHDPKVQRLKPETFKAWVNLLCLASEQDARGCLPPVSDVAFALRVKEDKAVSILHELHTAGLIDRGDDGVRTMHNWTGRQFGNDSSNDRVQRYRDRMRANGDTLTGYTKHRAAVFSRDGNACVYCGSTVKLVLDHLVPVNRGGDGQPDNLVTACKACNSGKAGRLVEETGYGFARPETVTQYEAVKSRLGLVTGAHAVTPVTVTVTPRVRADSEPDTEPDSEENPPTPGGGGAGGSETDPVILEITRAAEDMISGFGRMAGNACRKYPPAWVDEAVRITADARKSRWNYTQGILDRFQAQGHSDSERPARASPARAAPRPETPEEKKARHARLMNRIDNL